MKRKKKHLVKGQLKRCTVKGQEGISSLLEKKGEGSIKADYKSSNLAKGKEGENRDIKLRQGSGSVHEV